MYRQRLKQLHALALLQPELYRHCRGLCAATEVYKASLALLQQLFDRPQQQQQLHQPVASSEAASAASAVSAAAGEATRAGEAAEEEEATRATAQPQQSSPSCGSAVSETAAAATAPAPLSPSAAAVSPAPSRQEMRKALLQLRQWQSGLVGELMRGVREYIGPLAGGWGAANVGLGGPDTTQPTRKQQAALLAVCDKFLETFFCGRVAAEILRERCIGALEGWNPSGAALQQCALDSLVVRAAANAQRMALTSLGCAPAIRVYVSSICCCIRNGASGAADGSKQNAVKEASSATPEGSLLQTATGSSGGNSGGSVRTAEGGAPVFGSDAFRSFSGACRCSSSGCSACTGTGSSWSSKFAVDKRIVVRCAPAYTYSGCFELIKNAIEATSKCIYSLPSLYDGPDAPRAQDQQQEQQREGKEQCSSMLPVDIHLIFAAESGVVVKVSDSGEGLCLTEQQLAWRFLYSTRTITSEKLMKAQPGSFLLQKQSLRR
ncbi:pyruvate dehydrogenase [Cyclospora cayetanensis]|uniref:Pyruvate dehydrogenase n=1 Tax=Cyclospora cayetanensis TaxID=88456 RepID=A0A1D3D6N7_9EIME|nr:pyruvate dehydrogenase [Cyclospora cayetanensis]